MTAIKPRTAVVTIYQGDDLARLTALDSAVTKAEKARDKAKKSTDTRLITEDPVGEAQAAYDAAVAERDAFAAEADPRGVKVALHAVPRKKWRELARKHPARPDVDEDSMGVNMDEFPDALLPLSVCRDAGCPIEHEATTIEGDTETFLDSLSDHDYYDRLFLAAFALNRGSATADPTLRLGSTPSQTSDATSS